MRPKILVSRKISDLAEEKIQKVTERQKQIELAKLRGEVHIGE